MADYTPHVHILWNGDSPEMWLLYLNAEGILTPVGDFGPEPLPPEWKQLLLRLKSEK